MCVCGVYFLFGYISYYFYKSFPPPLPPYPPPVRLLLFDRLLLPDYGWMFESGVV